MREIVHIQAGQCGNQIGAKVNTYSIFISSLIAVKLFYHDFFVVDIALYLRNLKDFNYFLIQLEVFKIDASCAFLSLNK